MKNWEVHLHYGSEGTPSDIKAVVIVSADDCGQAASKARQFMRDNHPEAADSKLQAWVTMACHDNENETRPRKLP